MKHVNGYTGQFILEHNVEYKLINTFQAIELFKKHGVNLSEQAIGTRDLELIKAEALANGLPSQLIENILNECARELFTENKFGKFLLKRIREFVKEPITADGIVKKGFLNELAAYGFRINGITGKWGKARVIKNLVTDAGRAGVASRINGSGGEAAFTYIALGTGTTAAANGDTTLQTESSTSGLSRANSTASRVTTTVTNDTAQLVNTFSVTGTVAVTESGVLNASSNGTLLCRQAFSAINVVNGDSLQITWKVKAA